MGQSHTDRHKVNMFRYAALASALLLASVNGARVRRDDAYGAPEPDTYGAPAETCPPQGDDNTGEPGEEPTGYYQKGRGNSNSKGNMPKIVGPDTRAKNGVIHVINNVILQSDTLGPGDSSSSSSSSSDDGEDKCSGGKACGECKRECADNDGCRFSRVNWCKRDCEERFLDECGEGKICFGGYNCQSCQKECADFEGCERESTEECQTYCEEKWRDCRCTGGTSCGSCKGECVE